MQPLAGDFHQHEVQPGDIAVWTCKVRHQALSDHIAGVCDDRDAACGVFQRDGGGAARRIDEIHPQRNEFRGKLL